MLYLAKMHRLSSDYSQNVQNLLRLFRQCTECSESIQTMFRFFQTIFRLCSEFADNAQSECSESVQIFSEFLSQQLVYSNFLDFVVYSLNKYVHQLISVCRFVKPTFILLPKCLQNNKTIIPQIRNFYPWICSHVFSRNHLLKSLLACTGFRL